MLSLFVILFMSISYLTTKSFSLTPGRIFCYLLLLYFVVLSFPFLVFVNTLVGLLSSESFFTTLLPPTVWFFSNFPINFIYNVLIFSF